MATIRFVYQGKREMIEVSQPATVAAVVAQQRINPETVIVRKNNEIVPDTEPVQDGDTVEALRIISGG